MKENRIALIPAYEPDPLIISLLQMLCLAGFNCIVVDDGSGSAYTPLFTQAQTYALVLHHARHRGRGAALKTGFCAIMELFEPQSIVVTLSADGTYTVSDAERLCEEAECFPEALILGSCRQPGRSLRSRTENFISQTLCQAANRQIVTEPCTGLRACSAALLPTLLEIPGEGEAFEMNTLLECPRRCIEVREVRVAAVGAQEPPQHRLQIVRAALRQYRDILHTAASGMICLGADCLLFSLLYLLMGGLPLVAGLWLANAGARSVRSGLHLLLRRREGRTEGGRAVHPRLHTLLWEGLMLLGSSLLLTLLAAGLGCAPIAAKLLTEVLLLFLVFTSERLLLLADSR